MQARLEQFALAGAVEYFSQFQLQACQATKGIGSLEKINVFFGKIERCFNQHAQVDQFLGQSIDGF